jgi:hypothetical protein
MCEAVPEHFTHLRDDDFLEAFTLYDGPMDCKIQVIETLVTTYKM